MIAIEAIDIIARAKPSLFLGGSGGMLPPENFENRDCQIRIFNVLVNDSTHLLQENLA